jgi:hypothetical protein
VDEDGKSSLSHSPAAALTTATTTIELGAAFWNHRYAHALTCRPHGKNNNQVAHINSGSSPLEVSMFFAGVIRLLVMETVVTAAKFGQTGRERPTPQLDVTETEICTSSWPSYYRWDMT